MGSEFIRLYQTKVKQEWKLAFWAASISFLLIHIYKLTNTLPNHDSVYNVYSNQDVTSSGRWFLSVACGISSYFDLPWINGFLCAVYLGITAVVVVSLFNMKNPVTIILSAVLLSASPCTTETLFFEYTADGYLLGLTLSAFSALLSIKGNKWYHYVVSALLLCLSCGIYQAYVSFAMVLCICYFVLCVLDREMTAGAVWKNVGKHSLIYIGGLALYFGLWKLISAFTGVVASDYQGISTVGQISLSTLLRGALSSVKNLVYWFLGGNILQTPPTLYSVLHYILVIGVAIIIVFAIIRSKLHQTQGLFVTLLVCLASLIPAISIWNFLSDSVAYRPMMLHSVLVVFVLATVLCDKWFRPKLSTFFGLLMAVIIFNYALCANIAYFYLARSYEKSYYVGIQMMKTIEEISQESEVSSIAFVGNRHEDLYIIYNFPGNKAFPFSFMIEKDLLYDNSHAYLFLENTFGLDIPLIWDAQSRFGEHPEVEALNVWPSTNSAVIIEETLVIKLSN